MPVENLAVNPAKLSNSTHLRQLSVTHRLFVCHRLTPSEARKVMTCDVSTFDNPCGVTQLWWPNGPLTMKTFKVNKNLSMQSETVVRGCRIGACNSGSVIDALVAPAS